MVRQIPASAGEVREGGVERMQLATMKPRFTRWGRPASTFFLLAGVVVPHAIADTRGVYAFGFAAALVALEYVLTHLPRHVRAESIAWGLALAVLFFGLTEGTQVPNSAGGPLLLILAVLLSSFAFRAYPSYGEAPAMADRYSGLVVVLGTMWAGIMLVRTLQNWPPW